MTLPWFAPIVDPLVKPFEQSAAQTSSPARKTLAY
jgi:hypothetical protein